jgi:RHS repeat-associated protein
MIDPGSCSSAQRAAFFHDSPGKERDAETGLDYFGARYFSGPVGRFMSPDSGVDQHPSNPQRWNLYSYARNNPLLYIDPTGEYVCGSSMTADQCKEFQNGLDRAQASANKLKEKYGEDNLGYLEAQRSIDAFGKASVDNGVTIEIGNTGKYGGIISVEGFAGRKTAANPNGQIITATFSSALIGSALIEGHEGSHVADASAWVKSGFSNAMNPTQYQTEMDAYGVMASIGVGMDYSKVLATFGRTGTYTIYEDSGWHPSIVKDNIRSMLRGEYKLSPDNKVKAFQRNTRGGR